MALYEVLLRGVLNGQQHINRFNYVSSGTPASVSHSFALTSALGFIPAAGVFPADKFFAALLANVSPALAFLEVETRAIYSPTDFYVTPMPANAVGTYPGEQLPPTLAVGFRTNRVRTDIRRGTRRFGGLTETHLTGPSTWSSGAATGWATLATRMSAVLAYDDEGNTLTYSPCVVGRDSYVTGSGHTAYRYFESETAQMDRLALGIVWSPYAQARTQVSRQFGRGA